MFYGEICIVADSKAPIDVIDLKSDKLSRSWPPVFQWVAGRVPGSIKMFLLKRYWPLKEFSDYLVEYLLELGGFIPVHSLRLLILKGIGRVEIGTGSSVHRRCRVYRPEKVAIGDHSVINRDVLLDGRSGLQIGNNVSISEGTVILSLGHDIDDPDFALKGERVVIKDYVFIGSYSRILPGVTIGEGAVVGVGSVVTKDVDPYVVVAGVPACTIRERRRPLRYFPDYRKPFG